MTGKELIPRLPSSLMDAEAFGLRPLREVLLPEAYIGPKFEALGVVHIAIGESYPPPGRPKDTSLLCVFRTRRGKSYGFEIDAATLRGTTALGWRPFALEAVKLILGMEPPEIAAGQGSQDRATIDAAASSQWRLTDGQRPDDH
jgi:hypothetical protein